MDRTHRHHRQAILPFVGDEGQARLARAHALIVGCGALGCAAADLLARAGVGTLTIADRDVVEPTNLQRQTLYTDADAAAGAPKADAARRRLLAIDPSLDVRAEVVDVTHRNIERLCKGVGVVIDGTDNYETRYLLNDAAVAFGLPFVYGGAVGARGMVMNVLAGVTGVALPGAMVGALLPGAPCLRCVFPEPPPPEARQTCDTAGVLGAAPAIVGAFQAAEAIKALLGRFDAMRRDLLRFDLWTNEFDAADASAARDPDCPCCARREFSWLRGERAAGTTTLCGRDAVQISPSVSGASAPDLAALEAKLAPHARIVRTAFLLRATLHGERADPGSAPGNAPGHAENANGFDGGGVNVEITVFTDGRAVISGTTNPERARSIHAKYVGA